MSYFSTQNPGIGGIDELTTAEELIVQSIASLTGNSLKFLRVNAGETGVEYATIGGGGDVSKVGTPVNNQVGVWTGDGTIEGDAALTFDTTTDTLSSGTFLGTALTASEIVGTDASKNLVSLAVATYPSLTELAYAKGVTSAIQTQLNAKAPIASPTFTGTVTLPVALTGVLRADTGVVSVDTDVTDLVSAASTTVAGKVELATTAEIDTGTDTTRAMPVDQFVASTRNVRYVLYRVLEKATATSVLAGVGGDLEFPFTGTITEIGVFSDTAGVTGTMTVDVNKNGTTLMTTNKITVDTAEKTSRTAATAPALTTTSVTAGDIITVDVDAIQTTAALGLTLRLGVRLS